MSLQRIQKTIASFLGGREVMVVAPTTAVADVAGSMNSGSADCVLVAEQGVLVGIFTERDYLNRVIGAGKLPTTTVVRDVMTPDPDRLRSTDCVSYAIERMASGGFRNVPIVDDNHIVGVLHVRDVMTHLVEVLAEAEQAEPAADAAPWVDIGGG